MILLAFDTSTPEGGVALQAADGAVIERRIGSSVRHGESLLPAIAEVLAEAGHAPAALTGVVVGAGPGSFTGVRIAAASARGLVRALGCPLFTYGSLLAEAWAAGSTERPVCALFDARRGEVYAACYRFHAGGWDTLMEPKAAAVEDVVDELRAQGPVWAGEGAWMHSTELPETPVETRTTRAAALIRLARLAPERGRRPQPGAWEPDYLRPPGAERMRR